MKMWANLIRLDWPFFTVARIVTSKISARLFSGVEIEAWTHCPK